MEPTPITQSVPERSTLFKVTPLSKYLAMVIFIAMPFFGGYVGYTYAPEKVVEVERVVQSTDKETEPNIEVLGETVLPGWTTYTDEFEGYSYQYPPSWINNTEPVGPNTFSYVSNVDPATLKHDREVAIDSFAVLSKSDASCATPDKPITIAGKSAMDSSWVPAMVTECREITFSNGMTLILEAAFEGDQKKVLERILSTFEFQEVFSGTPLKERGNSDSSPMIFTDMNGLYSFKYPSQWQLNDNQKNGYIQLYNHKHSGEYQKGWGENQNKIEGGSVVKLVDFPVAFSEPEISLADFTVVEIFGKKAYTRKVGDGPEAPWLWTSLLIPLPNDSQKFVVFTVYGDTGNIDSVIETMFTDFTF